MVSRERGDRRTDVSSMEFQSVGTRRHDDNDDNDVDDDDEDVSRATWGLLFFRVASFPRRCGRSRGIKFLGRSCDQVNMHFFPLSSCSSSHRRRLLVSSLARVFFFFCSRRHRPVVAERLRAPLIKPAQSHGPRIRRENK